MEILLGLIAVVLIGGYVWYVTLIGRRNRALEALSSIDVQLRKRHDLIPNVLKIAQRFMEHEKELLTELTELRANAMSDYDKSDPAAVKNHIESEQRLQSGMMRFFATAEAYPELRSAETMVNAQETYSEVEGHISASRRFYNAAVTDLNNSVQIFPGSLIANMAGVHPMPFYEIEEAARAPVDASDFLK
ncbi:LemA family protein [Pyruvatibacter sp. HU-CL02332]|uniref:LemA family protein n=1 Tax=Pyruvatibacter sp. HU-CL02332 TaxID=3127650 RepID=UPI003109B5BA